MAANLPIVGIGASAGGVEALGAFFRADAGRQRHGLCRRHPSCRPITRACWPRSSAAPPRCRWSTPATAQTVEAEHVYVLPAGAVLTIRRRAAAAAPHRRRRSRARPDRCLLHLAGRGPGGACDRHRAVGRRQRRHPRPQGDQGEWRADRGPGREYDPAALCRDAVERGRRGLCRPAAAGRGNSRADPRLCAQLGRVRSRSGRATRCPRSTPCCARAPGTISANTRTGPFCAASSAACRCCRLTKLEDYVERLQTGPGRGQRAVSRPVDRRHRLSSAIPRPSRALETAGHAEAVRRTRAPTTRCASGYPAAPPARRPIRSRSCCASRWNSCAAPPKVQIFATDIDEAAIGVARAARYPANLVERGLARAAEALFRHRSERLSRAPRSLRDMCVFSAHSVIRDPPFSRLDLISCRNLLIYLKTELAGAGHSAVPLCAAAGRLPVPRVCRKTSRGMPSCLCRSTGKAASSSAATWCAQPPSPLRAIPAVRATARPPLAATAEPVAAAVRPAAQRWPAPSSSVSPRPM